MCCMQAAHLSTWFLDVHALFRGTHDLVTCFGRPNIWVKTGVLEDTIDRFNYSKSPNECLAEVRALSHPQTCTFMSESWVKVIDFGLATYFEPGVPLKTKALSLALPHKLLACHILEVDIAWRRKSKANGGS